MNSITTQQRAGVRVPMKVDPKPVDVDAYLNALPRAVRLYLQYETPVFWSPRQAYRLYRKLGTEGVLQFYKRVAEQDTALVYGLEHPQARRNNLA